MRRTPIGVIALALLAIHAQSFRGVTIRCRRPSDLQAVSKRQTYIYDGGELQSFLIANNDLSNANSRQAQVGSITFVTGTTDESRRIIGVEKNDDGDGSREVTSLGETCVYSDTVAEIPSRVSDEDALKTASASLVGIHCSLPAVEAVGGSANDVFYSGKVSSFVGSLHSSRRTLTEVVFGRRSSWEAMNTLALLPMAWLLWALKFRSLALEVPRLAIGVSRSRGPVATSRSSPG